MREALTVSLPFPPSLFFQIDMHAVAAKLEITFDAARFRYKRIKQTFAASAATATVAAAAASTAKETDGSGSGDPLSEAPVAVKIPTKKRGGGIATGMDGKGKGGVGGRKRKVVEQDGEAACDAYPDADGGAGEQEGIMKKEKKKKQKTQKGRDMDDEQAIKAEEGECEGV